MATLNMGFVMCSGVEESRGRSKSETEKGIMLPEAVLEGESESQPL